MDSPAEYVQAVHDMVDVAGVDHVGIGTDTKLALGSSPWWGGPKGGPCGPGSAPGRGRRGERTNQAWADQTLGFYYVAGGGMVKQGFKDDETAKVGGGNFCRVFGQVTASRS